MPTLISNRTTVESVCKDLDRLLFTTLYPLLTNFLLRCRLSCQSGLFDFLLNRELIGLVDLSGMDGDHRGHKDKLLSLAYQVEVMFFKV